MNNMLAEWYLSGGMIFVYVILIFGAIGIVGYCIKKYVIDKNKVDETPDTNSEKFVQSELDRILEKVEDEETAKEINNYKENDDN